MFFQNRTDAGVKLAKIIADTGKDFSGWSIAGIARGGVIVGAEIASALNLGLQAICTDDLHLGGGRVLVASSLYSGMIFSGNQPPEFVPNIKSIQGEELPEFIWNLESRTMFFNNGPFVPGKKVIVCDDGLVSGRTLIATVASLRHSGVSEVLAAVPVIPSWAANGAYGFEILTWRVSKMSKPTTGMFYFNFEDVPDEEVAAAAKAG